MSTFLTSNRPNIFFRLGPHLGGGGFADVYRCLAIEYVLRSRVSALAVKILRNAWDPEVLNRFIAEAHILKGVRHPNLVPVVDINLNHDPPYYLMPLMRETLADLLARHRRANGIPRTRDAIRKVILPISRALAVLHSRGIFHRDVKPANIFFDARGVAMLGDLGICHFPTVYFPSLSLQTLGMGTPGYTAPETLKFGIGTPQSDTYSVGIVLYEMITGFLPPKAWWHNPACRPSLRHPRSCHPYVDEVIAKMTCSNPRLRYATISAAIENLQTIDRDYLSRLPAYAPPIPLIGAAYGLGAPQLPSMGPRRRVMRLANLIGAPRVFPQQQHRPIGYALPPGLYRG